MQSIPIYQPIDLATVLVARESQSNNYPKLANLLHLIYISIYESFTCVFSPFKFLLMNMGEIIYISLDKDELEAFRKG